MVIEHNVIQYSKETNKKIIYKIKMQLMSIKKYFQIKNKRKKIRKQWFCLAIKIGI
jgi:hypothetical protein